VIGYAVLFATGHQIQEKLINCYLLKSCVYYDHVLTVEYREVYVCNWMFHILRAGQSVFLMKVYQ